MKNEQENTKKEPLRRCIGCNTMKPKSELIRVVRAPDGTISVDKTSKESGRGAYICKDSECLVMVLKSKALSRTFKADVPEEVQRSLLSAFDKLHAAGALDTQEKD